LYIGDVFDPAASESGTVPAVPPTGILPVQRLGAVVEVLLCSGFPTQLLLIGILTGFGMSFKTVEGQLSPPFVFTLSLLDAAIVVGLVLFFLKAHRESPRAVLLGRRRAAPEIFLGVILLPVVFMLVVVVLALVLTYAPQLHNVPRNPLEDMLQNRQDALVFGVVVMIAGGVREEIQRGFILHRFDQYLGGGVVGVVVFSALFGLGHIDQGLDAAIATGLLGAAWGTVYLVRRSIIAPMVSHAGFNLLQLVKYAALR
jgi:membrane protease YdiL (CAAX protease family)